MNPEQLYLQYQNNGGNLPLEEFLNMVVYLEPNDLSLLIAGTPSLKKKEEDTNTNLLSSQGLYQSNNEGNINLTSADQNTPQETLNAAIDSQLDVNQLDQQNGTSGLESLDLESSLTSVNNPTPFTTPLSINTENRLSYKGNMDDLILDANGNAKSKVGIISFPDIDPYKNTTTFNSGITVPNIYLPDENKVDLNELPKNYLFAREYKSGEFLDYSYQDFTGASITDPELYAKDLESKGYIKPSYLKDGTRATLENGLPAYTITENGAEFFTKESKKYVEQNNNETVRQNIGRDKPQLTDLQEYTNSLFEKYGYLVTEEDRVNYLQTPQGRKELQINVETNKELASYPGATYQQVYDMVSKRYNKSDEFYLGKAESILSAMIDNQREQALTDFTNNTSQSYSEITPDDVAENKFYSEVQNSYDLKKLFGEFLDSEEGELYIRSDQSIRNNTNSQRNRKKLWNAFSNWVDQKEYVDIEAKKDYINNLKLNVSKLAQLGNVEELNQYINLIDKTQEGISKNVDTLDSNKKIADELNKVFTKVNREDQQTELFKAKVLSGDALARTQNIAGNVVLGLGQSVQDLSVSILQAVTLPFSQNVKDFIAPLSQPLKIGNVEISPLRSDIIKYSDEKGNNYQYINGSLFLVDKDKKYTPSNKSITDLKQRETDSEYNPSGMAFLTAKMAGDILITNRVGGIVNTAVARSSRNTAKIIGQAFGEQSAIAENSRNFARYINGANTAANRSVSGWFVQTWGNDYNNAEEAGIQSTSGKVVYATVNSFIQSLTQRINPDSKFLSGFNNEYKQLLSSLSTNSRERILANAKGLFLKISDNVVGETKEEVIQQLVGDMTNYVTNIISTSDFKLTDVQGYKDVVVGTIVPSAIASLMGGSGTRNVRLGNKEINLSKYNRSELLTELSRFEGAENMLNVMSNDSSYDSYSNTLSEVKTEVLTRQKYINRIPDTQNYSTELLDKGIKILQELDSKRSDLNRADDAFKPRIQSEISSLELKLDQTLNETPSNENTTPTEQTSEGTQGQQDQGNKGEATNSQQGQTTQISKPNVDQILNETQNPNTNEKTNNQQNDIPQNVQQQEQQSVPDQKTFVESTDSSTQITGQNQNAENSNISQEVISDDLLAKIDTLFNDQTRDSTNANETVVPTSEINKEQQISNSETVETNELPVAANGTKVNENDLGSQQTSVSNELNPNETRLSENVIATTQEFTLPDGNTGYRVTITDNNGNLVEDKNGDSAFDFADQTKVDKFIGQKQRGFSLSKQNRTKSTSVAGQSSEAKKYVGQRVLFNQFGDTKSGVVASENKGRLTIKGDDGKRYLTGSPLVKDVTDDKGKPIQFQNVSNSELSAKLTDVQKQIDTINKGIKSILQRSKNPRLQVLYKERQRLQEEIYKQKKANAKKPVAPSSIIGKLNEQFNNIIDNYLSNAISNKKARKTILSLGNPNKILLEQGIEDLPIELSLRKLNIKASPNYKSNHPFELNEIKNLVEAIQDPVAIFKHPELKDNFIVVTDLKDKDGKLLLIAFNKELHIKGENINDVKTIFPIDVKRINNWIKSDNKKIPLTIRPSSKKPLSNSISIPPKESGTNVQNNIDNTQVASEKKRVKTLLYLNEDKFSKENPLQIDNYNGVRTVYHGTNAQIANKISKEGIKSASELSDKQWHAGGYGVGNENSFSTSLDPDISKDFSADGKAGIVKIELSPDAKIVSVENDIYAEDLDRYKDQLKGVDAVYLKNNGQGEIVILNKDKAIIKGSRVFEVKQNIPKLQSPGSFTTISKQAFDLLIEKLKKPFSKAFKNLNVTTDWNEFINKSKSLGLTINFNAQFGLNDNASDQGEGQYAPVKFMRNNNGTIYGAKLPDGTIYINPEYLNANTPIHEFSHLWEQLMPSRFKKGVELLKQTKRGKEIFNRLKSDGNYDHLSDNELWGEALNTHIGNYGEWQYQQRQAIGKMAEFVQWFKDLFNKIGDVLGIGNLNPNISLNNFTNKVLGDLLGDKTLIPENGVSESGTTNFSIRNNITNRLMPVSTIQDVINETQTNGFEAGLAKFKESAFYNSLSDNQKAVIDREGITKLMQEQFILHREDQMNKKKTAVEKAKEQTSKKEKQIALNKIEKIHESYKNKIEQLRKSDKPSREKIAQRKREAKEAYDKTVILLNENMISGKITPTEVSRLLKAATGILSTRNSISNFSKFTELYNKINAKAQQRNKTETERTTDKYNEVSKWVEQQFNSGKSLQQIKDSFKTIDEQRMAESAYNRLSNKNLSPEEARKKLDDSYQSSKEVLTKRFKDENGNVMSFNQKFRAWLKNKIQRGIVSGVDRQFIPKRILENIGAKAVLNRMIAYAGSSTKAKEKFDKVEKNVYDGLNRSQLELLDKIIAAKRFIAIDKNREQKGLPVVDHPGYQDASTAQKALDAYKSEIGEDKFKDLDKRANAYFDAFKNILSDMRKSGLISNQVYEQLKDVDYQPRKFLRHILDADGELMSSDATLFRNENGNLSKEQIASLSQGDASDLLMDSKWLIQSALASRYKAIGMNEINRTFFTKYYPDAKAKFESIDPNNIAQSDKKFYKYFKELQSNIKENRIIGFTQSGKPKYENTTPKGYKIAYYYENGVRHQVFMKEEFHKMWHDTMDKLIGSDMAPIISILSGSRLLKAFATGNNPGFAFVNTPRDFVHTLLFSPEYSSFLLRSGAQLTKDSIKAIGEIYKHKNRNKTTLLTKYLEYGGGMEWLNQQGEIKDLTSLNKTIGNYFDSRIDPKIKKILNILYDWVRLKSVSNYSETMFRVGVFDRSLQNRLKEYNKLNNTSYKSVEELSDEDKDDMYHQAVASARQLLDFNQGGTFTKSAEAVIPYMNTATQGTRVMLETFKRNPLGTSVRFIQAAGLPILGIHITNNLIMGLIRPPEKEDEPVNKSYADFLDGISPVQKMNYWNIPVGWNKEKNEWKVLRIAKAQQLTPISILFEGAYEDYIRGTVGMTKRGSIKNTWKNFSNALGDNVDPIHLASALADPSKSKNYFDAAFKLASGSPTVKGLMQYYTGYDIFRNQPLSFDIGKVSRKYEGADKANVEEFYKELGKALDDSPVRLKSFVESIITSPQTNPFVDIMYGGADAIVTDVDAKQKAGAIYKSLLKRILNETNDFNRQLNSKALIQDQLDKNNDEYAETRNKAKEIFNKYTSVNELLNNEKSVRADIEGYSKDPLVQSNLINQIKSLLKKDGISSMVFDVKYSTNNNVKNKALLIYTYQQGMSREQKIIFYEQLQSQNILTKDVISEYEDLVKNNTK